MKWFGCDMNFMFQFAGKLLDMLYNYVPVYGICIVLLALTDKLLFYFAGKKYYSTIKLKEVLAPLVKKNNQKYTDNPTKKAEELTKLLAGNQYPIFGGIGNLVTEAIFSLGVLGLFQTPALYLAHGASGGVLRFLSLDLAASPLALLRAPASAPTELIASFLLVAAALGAIIIHDKIMESYAFIDQSYNKILWIAFAAAFIFCNHAFTLYWLAIKLLDFANILLVKRFYVVSVQTKTKQAG